MPATFAVDDVEIQGAPHTLLDLPVALRARTAGRIRCSAGPARVIEEHSDLNPLMQAVHCAFARHRPLALSPDAIWSTIAHGFAIHVVENAEALRGRFVRHEGKLELNVEHASLDIAADEWPPLISSLCGRIREHVGPGLHRLLVNDFSTTGPAERTASEITMMHAFKQYFDYSVTCICGIPEITLLGTADDWRAIRGRLDVLEEYDLGWWTRKLAPVCDQFVRAAEGRPDRAFWQAIYKPKAAYAVELATGWIRLFFPYLQGEGGKFVRSSLEADGLPPRQFPMGLSSAPVRIDEPDGSTREMVNLVGGLVGVWEDPDRKTLRPELGWAVHSDAAATALARARTEPARQPTLRSRLGNALSRKPSGLEPNVLPIPGDVLRLLAEAGDRRALFDGAWRLRERSSMVMLWHRMPNFDAVVFADVGNDRWLAWCHGRRERLVYVILDSLRALDLATPIVALSLGELFEHAEAHGPRFFEAPAFRPHGTLMNEV